MSRNTGIIIPKLFDTASGELNTVRVHTFDTVGKMTNDISKKKGKSSSDKKTKRKAKRRETYAMYIYKVLKQVGEL